MFGIMESGLDYPEQALPATSGIGKTQPWNNLMTFHGMTESAIMKTRTTFQQGIVQWRDGRQWDMDLILQQTEDTKRPVVLSQHPPFA